MSLWAYPPHWCRPGSSCQLLGRITASGGCVNNARSTLAASGPLIPKPSRITSKAVGLGCPVRRYHCAPQPAAKIGASGRHVLVDEGCQRRGLAPDLAADIRTGPTSVCTQERGWLKNASGTTICATRLSSANPPRTDSAIRRLRSCSRGVASIGQRSTPIAQPGQARRRVRWRIPSRQAADWRAGHRSNRPTMLRVKNGGAPASQRRATGNERHPRQRYQKQQIGRRRLSGSMRLAATTAESALPVPPNR